jgi:hypothetical protein
MKQRPINSRYRQAYKHIKRLFSANFKQAWPESSVGKTIRFVVKTNSDVLYSVFYFIDKEKVTLNIYGQNNMNRDGSMSMTRITGEPYTPVDIDREFAAMLATRSLTEEYIPWDI